MVSNRFKKFALPTLGGGLVAAAVVAGLVVAPSGADFSASKQGTVAAHAATVDLDLGDSAGWHQTFNLGFNNLTPGKTQSQTFYVKNTGSIPANVSLGLGTPNGVTFHAPHQNVDGNPAANPSKLLVGISDYKALTPAPQWAAGQVNLGSLQPGEQRAYTLNFLLDSTAGNEWQDATVTANAMVTLHQQ